VTTLAPRAILVCLALLALVRVAHADDLRKNRGNDPFFQISSAIADCPAPLGPLTTEREWLEQAHSRIERGNSCWVEGRCRLSNGYKYDAEIAEAVRRRLQNIQPATRWKEKTTLWLVLQRRFIHVQGCVASDFDKRAFLFELAKTADADKVLDETMVDGKAAKAPYPLASPHTGRHTGRR
jgi:hypothetical protein